MKNLLITTALLLSIASCKAQPPTTLSTTSKKATDFYNSGMDCAMQYDYTCAYAKFEAAKKADPNFCEPYFMEANLYMEQGQWQKAIDQFKLGFAINPKLYPSNFYDCANSELKLGKYADAKIDYQNYLNYATTGSATMKQLAQDGIATCDFATNAMANPVPFNPLNIGDGINSTNCEYFPNVTADDQTFLFTRNSQTVDPNNGALTQTQEDFYISFRDDSGHWSLARNMGPPINSDRNEGAPSLSADGRYLFFAACEEYDGYGNGRQGYGSCDIFITQKINNVWTKPKNVGAPVNTGSWESQPSFSSDGKTLYFVSNRKGGKGGSDIWMAVLNDDGNWSAPVDLGDNINTAGQEEAVFIHPDNQTLYFASDGHPGLGGLDLYVCRRDTVTGKWGPATNLGYPINTYADESGMIVNGNGQMAYYSSTRDGGKGCDDIYCFSLPKTLQPVPVTYMKGKVYNKKTLKPVGAEFDLLDLATGSVVISSNSDPVTGEFLVCLPTNKNYALNVTSPGYLFYSETFQMKTSADPSKPYKMDVPLQPIEDSSLVELKNVFFATGKFDLQPQSKAELNRAAQWLKANPNVHVEIAGHTDNVGDKKSNQLLSENRAKAVYDYLVAQGIDATRMTYKGYGDTKPKVANDTPEHKQMNRRVEMRITSTK
ncbi:MAG TPA: OmpA family protein [Bacteroidia bacterium]|jgi:outer membrane protein OmpA-like peptidoglycan-associated protein|nr:OmpA family protein [Bacteroidia bacterium]